MPYNKRRCHCATPLTKACAFLPLTTVVAALAVGSAQAQVALPSSVEPGAIERRFRNRPPEIREEPSGGIVIPQLPDLQIPPGAESKKIFLKGITVKNVTAGKALTYADQELSTLYTDIIENEVPLSKLFDVANSITAKYGNDGYILSFAYVPPQNIVKNGVATINVIEGFIDKVEFDRAKLAGRSELIDALINRISASVPLNNRDLERSLLLLNDFPGLSVKSNIQASKSNRGASTLVLEISQKKIDTSVSLDNRGSRSLGKYQTVGNIAFNSLFGLYERTTLTYARSFDAHEFSYAAFSQQHILNELGTTLAVSGSKSWSQPGDRLKALEVESAGTTLGFTITHPLIRSRRENVSLQGGFTYRNSTTEQLQQKSSEDRTRYITFGINYDSQDSLQGSNVAQIALSHGFDVFNATHTNDLLKSRINGKPDFTKLNIDLIREQRINQEFSIQGRASGQWSADSLLSAQEFTVGGEPFGRAYDSSEITGDHGISGNLEARYTPELDIPHVRNLQFFTYYDIGAVFQRSPINKPKRESAASVGIGIRGEAFDTLSGAIELDQPLTRAVAEEQARGNNGKAPRLFFRVSVRY